MPVYQAPGVYVEEVPGTPPIAGVGTSTAAFIGELTPKTGTPPGQPTPPDLKMPLKLQPANADDRLPLPKFDKPYLVTSFEQFKTSFGDFQKGNSLLAHACFSFFLNGGTTCYVVGVKSFDDVANALAQLARIDQVAIVAAPGALKKAVLEGIVSWAEKLQDRFVILDGQRITEIDEQKIKGELANNDYAALYYPWVQVKDQTLVEEAKKEIEEWRPKPDAKLWLPPSAPVAGIYARVDESRGVHKAPANERVRGALALEYVVTHGEQTQLNPKGVNVIRDFSGTIRVWGARTLGGEENGEFRYVNVRRLFLFLRESIDEGTQFAVFEPNSPPLWQKIRRSVTAFLTNVWRDGALFGNSPEEAFYVKCDETTNPVEVRDAGMCITEIGVAVVKPAEFVIFRISQVTLPSA